MPTATEQCSGAGPVAKTPGRQGTHKAVCATCLRPLDIWPDGVLHKDARFDMTCSPDHHEAIELA